MNGNIAAAMAPDEDLVFRFRAGEEDAFSQLYARYRRRVFATAYRIMRNPEDAQDAAQEIFLKLYRSLPDWNSEKSRLSTWLYRMAANQAIDMWRVRNRRCQNEVTGEGAGKIVARVVDENAAQLPFQALHSKERSFILKQWTESLPRLQRRFFILRYFLDLSLEEIARVEHRSLGTVKGLLFRATHSVRVKASRASGRCLEKTVNPN
jgi:RNA polymerase sigma-70 factor, ECF subfamily